MCRNNVNNSYPLASPKMLSAFQILAKKVPSSPRVWGLRGIQNNPRGGKYLDKLHLGGRHLSNDKFQYFIRIFGPRRARKYHRTETSWKFGKFVQEICLDSNTLHLFSICIVFFCDSKRHFFHFFFQIQELIVKTTPPPPPPQVLLFLERFLYIRKYNANLI